ncbi:hypothetical protein [Mycobacterium noviomagense]|uniref:hypothetical protein n=1 Tax=Mycobacterium noviomagense TaxID=459858 RepID=UPI001E3B2C67|nr:hypothetical protein [Mycobacterium noviomagense]
MTTNQVRGLVLAAAMLGVVGAVAIPSAHADAVDTNFLQPLKAKGINSPPRNPRSSPVTRSAMNSTSVGSRPTSPPT